MRGGFSQNEMFFSSAKIHNQSFLLNKDQQLQVRRMTLINEAPVKHVKNAQEKNKIKRPTVRSFISQYLRTPVRALIVIFVVVVCAVVLCPCHRAAYCRRLRMVCYIFLCTHIGLQKHSFSTFATLTKRTIRAPSIKKK